MCWEVRKEQGGELRIRGNWMQRHQGMCLERMIGGWQKKHGVECHCLLPLVCSVSFLLFFCPPQWGRGSGTMQLQMMVTSLPPLLWSTAEGRVCFCVCVFKMPLETRVYQVSWQRHTWQSATCLPSFSSPAEWALRCVPVWIKWEEAVSTNKY